MSDLLTEETLQALTNDPCLGAKEHCDDTCADVRLIAHIRALEAAHAAQVAQLRDIIFKLNDLRRHDAELLLEQARRRELAERVCLAAREVDGWALQPPEYWRHEDQDECRRDSEALREALEELGEIA